MLGLQSIMDNYIKYLNKNSITQQIVSGEADYLASWSDSDYESDRKEKNNHSPKQYKERINMDVKLNKSDAPLGTPVVDVGTIILAFLGGRFFVFLRSFMVAVVRETKIKKKKQTRCFCWLNLTLIIIINLLHSTVHLLP